MTSRPFLSATDGAGSGQPGGGPSEGDERLRRIIDSMADAVVVVDRDGVVKFANPAAEELFGRPRDEVVGDDFGLPLVTGETTEVDLQGGRIAEMRVVDLAWKGEMAWLASLRDVTARREAEQAARRLWRERAAREEVERERERLREEERAKDHFLAVLGHELRNPLAGIDGGLRLLEQGVDGERARWSLAMMRKQMGALKRLLDDLLDVSAITRGKLRLQRGVVPLADLVEMAVAAVDTRYEERGQRLEVSLPEESLLLDGDAQRLVQVLANLLVNASKYSEPGATVTLAAHLDDGTAVIEVRDQGSGIEPAMLERVFEPFVQAGDGSPQPGGLGIGLTLVRQIVELHGGSVVAASAGPGRGSTFSVRLPAAAATEPAVAPATGARWLRSLKVVVIDDNEDAGWCLAELLCLKGCAAAAVRTGTEGLALAREVPPDVVLLDLHLPDLTGYEVARRLRRQPDLDGLLIIAISGFGNDDARRRVRESGIDHHLVKPADLDELLGLMARHGQRSRRISSAGAPATRSIVLAVR